MKRKTTNVTTGAATRYLRPRARSEISELELTTVSQEFHPQFFLAQCTDGFSIDPVINYCQVGWIRGFDPAPWFSSTYYLTKYPDIKTAGMNPFFHYLVNGRKEGRFASKGYEELDHRVVETIAKTFDAADYRKQLAKKGESHLDPILHFLNTGWKEGFRPVPWFDPKFYLATYEDVVASNANPFFHYLTLGQSEGRSPSQGEWQIQQDAQQVEPMFDANYYLLKNPDVAAAGVDPLKHFVTTGWREGRKPSSAFDPKYYLEVYQDVRIWGGNPLLHYLRAGRAEGRNPVPPGPARLRLLESATRPGEVNFDWAYDFAAIKAAKLRNSILGKSKRTKLVLSVSHDCYLSSVGGVQLFISEERKNFEAKGLRYLNIFPMRPGAALRAEGDKYEIGICLDGRVIGAMEVLGFLAVLKRMKTDRVLTLEGLIIHSIAGHDPEVLAKLSTELKADRTMFWAHDYFGLCQNHNLLRNNIEFCGPPKVGNPACDICVSSVNRAAQVQRTTKLLKSTRAQVITPSAAAASVWSTGMPQYRVHKIVPHRAIRVSRKKLAVRAANNSQCETPPLRIAYCGHPAHHKGWSYFTQLVDLMLTDQTVEFYHLGTQNTETTGLQFVEANTMEKADAMADALRTQAIDCVFLGSIWPETFCYVFYETLSAGVPVLAFPESGNVADLIHKKGYGLIIGHDMRNTAEAIKSEKFLADLSNAKRNIGGIVEIAAAGTSAAIWN